MLGGYGERILLTVEMIEALSSESPHDRVAAAIYFDSLVNQELGQLARVVGVNDPEPVLEELIQQGQVVELALSPQKKALSASKAPRVAGKAAAGDFAENARRSALGLRFRSPEIRRSVFVFVFQRDV